MTVCVELNPSPLAIPYQRPEGCFARCMTYFATLKKHYSIPRISEILISSTRPLSQFGWFVYLFPDFARRHRYQLKFRTSVSSCHCGYCAAAYQLISPSSSEPVACISGGLLPADLPDMTATSL
ncbi:hypothetical protein RvY_05200 [Ramazzottius varieornatus]|uniref:Uncharacterized protein n=1 Tax=Ramazzottius varieornatus TaxID=947166 RepID=A0A1D1V426_RAMVA|nr:hypothetical protein RvY_05200 [Ramazzottius varieornatus]